MASLHIKHFGPIEDSTRIEFTPLMVLIGRQSSGKTTFMKVLCFCRWIEKRVMVSTDDIINQYTHYGRFVKELKQFHRLNDDYFKKNTSKSFLSKPSKYFVFNLKGIFITSCISYNHFTLSNTFFQY